MILRTMLVVTLIAFAVPIAVGQVHGEGLVPKICPGSIPPEFEPCDGELLPPLPLPHFAIRIDGIEAIFDASFVLP